MSPYPATRRNGACFGSLWKQHTCVAVPPNLSSFATSSSPAKASSYHGSSDVLSRTLDANERGKSHDYCVLVGNTLKSYFDVWSYKKGDHPTSEVRIVGASAWNPPATSTSSAGLGGSQHSVRTAARASSPLSSATLASEAQATSSPTAATTVSTKSTTSGPPTFRLVTYAGTHIYCSAPTAADRDIWLAALHSGLEASYASYAETLSALSNGACGGSKSGGSGGGSGGGGVSGPSKGEPMPRTLTQTDQHLLTPPVPQRRARLPQLFRRRVSATPSSGSGSSGAVYSSHGYRNPYDNPDAPLAKTHCISCGRFPPDPAMKKSSAPLPQYGMESRSDLCQECLISQGLLSHVHTLCGLYSCDAHERAALRCARDEAVRAVEKAVRDSEKERSVRTAVSGGAASSLAQPQQVEKDKHAVEATTRDATQAKEQGGSSSSGSGSDSHPEDAAGGSEEDTSGGTSSSWTNVEESNHVQHDHPPTVDEVELMDEDVDEDRVIDEKETEGGDSDEHDTDHDAHTTASSTLSGSWTNVDKPASGGGGAASADAAGGSSLAWVNLPPTAASTKALLELIQTPGFTIYRRRSRALDLNCRMLEDGGIGCAAEFLETLNESAKEAGCAENAAGDRSAEGSAAHEEEIGLKKEAFKVAGDMGAAMKMLHDNALPHERKDSGGSVIVPPGSANSTEMLAVILEFLLDLCDEGEIGSVAFFWPQLRQIHLRMLPPVDADSLVRVELLEDFFLTVCTRYSVHLALDLVWGLIADLEESLGSPASCGAECRRRRFAVLRFVCELESLLFDFDGGWGGGSVSLRGMLSPSQHQAVLMRDAFSILQLHRRFGAHRLTRSVRHEKIREEAFEGLDDNPSASAPDARARQIIARNADYFSCHLMFARRLGDIAEQLRFTDLEKRSATLEQSLDTLNASRMLGGDPLNVICDDGGLVSVVHVPSKEGHVFRSKERTPVLLLMEVIREGGSCGVDCDHQNHVVSADNSEEEMVRNGVQEQTNEVEETSGPTLEDEVLKEDETVDPTRNETDQSLTVDAAKNDENDKEAPTPLNPPTEWSNTTSFAESSVEGGADIMATAAEDDADIVGTSSYPPSPAARIKPSVDLNIVAPSPKPAVLKLKRLESPSMGGDTKSMTPTADTSVTPESKKMMENMIANMMQNQLHLPSLDESSAQNKKDESSESEVCSPPNQSSDKDDNSLQREEGSLEPDSSVKRSVSPTTTSGRRSSARRKQQTRSSASASSLGVQQRKISAFGSLVSSTGAVGEHGDTTPSQKTSISLEAHGEGRREVLTTIMVKGMAGQHVIAKGAAAAARRAVQAMDRKRAVALLNGTNTGRSIMETGAEQNHNRNVAESPALYQRGSNDDEGVADDAIDEDEAMEALRLLLIQNRVAQGNLSPEDAALVMAPGRAARKSNESEEVVQGGDSAVSPISENPWVEETDDYQPVDAGDVDPRLAGCGLLSAAVLSALRLWKDGIVSNGELLELVQKDLQFLKHSALPGAANESKLMEDSAFWGRFAFGERWAEKKARIAASSPHGSDPGWDLVGVIVKSNDDLRQEAFVMQLIELCQEAFEMAGLELWVHPYRIVATGRTTGIIEMVRNAMSFDSLKKRPGYGTDGLKGHFQRMTEFAADPAEAFQDAQRNFVRSLAAYSLMSYLFMFKDRHNGNLLLDTAGHVIHIDFGFVFGIAPGGSFSLEQSTPFKLTDEMLGVMDGLGSPLFSEFVTLFCCGFLALQAHLDTFVTVVEITCRGSTFKCFEGKDPSDVASKLRERFCPHLNKEQTVAFALDLIKQATASYGTKQYDYFQYLSQGIAT